MYAVTFGFKRAFRYTCKTRKTAASRSWMKKDANRRYRRAVRREIQGGSYDFFFKPFATGWDVI